jgi:hypothetical protein
MRETETLHRNFLEFEDEFDLFHRRVSGILFWEFVRTRVYFQLYFKSLGHSGEITPSYSLVDRIRFYFSSIINFVRNPFFTRKTDLVIVGHPRRLLGDDGQWWDIYTDTFIDYLDTQYVAIEESYYLDHRKPAKTNSLFYFDFIDTIARMKSFLKLTKFHMTKKEYEMLSHLRQVISDRFGIDVNLEHIVKITLQIRSTKLSLYIKLLKRIRPRLVLLVNSLGKETLIEACKKLDITTAELQHGVINNYHPTYSFSDKTRRFTFPDYLLVWGDYWKETVNYPIPQANVVSVGFPFIENELDKYENTEKKQQILIISQGQVGSEISKLALELSKKIDPEYKIVYKLHPAEVDTWKHLYPWLVNTDVEVIDRKDTSLHQLFSKSIAQIGIGSTAVYEGLAHGLYTYILDTSGAEYFDDLAQKGYVVMISSPADFLKHFMSREKYTVPDTQIFFKKKSIHNIIRFIHSILDG